MAFVGQHGNSDPDADTPDTRDAPPVDPPAPGASDPSFILTSRLPTGVQAYVGTSSKRTRIIIAGAVTLALGGACLYTFLVDPNNPSNAYPKCPLKALTDIDCPGCGGLRATNALLHGDIVGAADHNLLALVLLPVMAFLFLRWVLAQFDVVIPTIRWPHAFTWITPAVLIAFTIARNINVPGLHWLNSGIA